MTKKKPLMHLLAVATLVLLLLLLLPAAAALAQGSCNASGTNATCSEGGTNAYRIEITITRAVLLSLSSAGIALDAPGAAEFDAGFGQTAGPTLTVKSNAPWALTARVTQPLWTASPTPARADKPASDLQWSILAGGPFADFSTSDVAVQSGAGPTAGTPIPLYLRVKYAWLLDTPGSYTIPVLLTITAP